MVAQALNLRLDIQGCTVIKIYNKWGTAVEEPPECYCTVMLCIFYSYFLNALYYYANILLPLHYMDCISFHQCQL